MFHKSNVFKKPKQDLTNCAVFTTLVVLKHMKKWYFQRREKIPIVQSKWYIQLWYLDTVALLSEKQYKSVELGLKNLTRWIIYLDKALAPKLGQILKPSLTYEMNYSNFYLNYLNLPKLCAQQPNTLKHTQVRGGRTNLRLHWSSWVNAL